MHSHIPHPSPPLLAQILAALRVRQLKGSSSGYLKEGFPLYLSYMHSSWQASCCPACSPDPVLLPESETTKGSRTLSSANQLDHHSMSLFIYDAGIFIQCLFYAIFPSHFSENGVSNSGALAHALFNCIPDLPASNVVWLGRGLSISARWDVGLLQKCFLGHVSILSSICPLSIQSQSF